MNHSSNLILCEDCGNLVPEQNLAIHQVRCRNERSHHDTDEEDDETFEMAMEEEVPVVSSLVDLTGTSPPTSPSTSPNHRANVVDLSGSPPTTLDDDDEVPENLWSCPRCTLLNAEMLQHCEACHYDRNTIFRPPDPIRRRVRLVDDDDDHFLDGSSSFLPASAVVGGVLGAAGAYFRGRSMGSGLLQGAVSGAIGASILNDIIGSLRSRRNRSSPVSEARTSASEGLPGYPSLHHPIDLTEEPDSPSSDSSQPSPRQPRPSFRVVRQTLPDGTRTTIVSSSTAGGESGRHWISSRRIEGETSSDEEEEETNEDPFLDLLLRSMVQASTAAELGDMTMGGLDAMSYDQLLRAFGDGTENMAASEEAIESLESERVPEKESEDTCPICLDDYEKGQVRKTLPCSHRFHGCCIDKWLRSNGACPICKSRLEG